MIAQVGGLQLPSRATFAAPLGFALGTAWCSRSVGQDMLVRAVKTKSSFSKYRGICNPGIGSGPKNIGLWLRSLRGQ